MFFNQLHKSSSFFKGNECYVTFNFFSSEEYPDLQSMAAHL